MDSIPQASCALAMNYPQVKYSPLAAGFNVFDDKFLYLSRMKRMQIENTVDRLVNRGSFVKVFVFGHLTSLSVLSMIFPSQHCFTSNCGSCFPQIQVRCSSSTTTPLFSKSGHLSVSEHAYKKSTVPMHKKLTVPVQSNVKERGMPGIPLSSMTKHVGENW